MAFRKPSFNSSGSMKQKLTRNTSSFKVGPQIMNIAQPLSRASFVADLASQEQHQKQQKSSQTYQAYLSSYYHQLPRIPRPKRYYSTWNRGTTFSVPSKKSLTLPNLQISRRSISSANQKIRSKTVNLHKRFFSTEARKKRQQRRRFIKWWTITSLTVVLGGVASKIRYERRGYDEEEHIPFNEYAIKPQSWHLYVYSTLPLKAMSRLWGQFNSIELPIWLRSPSYMLYSTIFGVNLNEMAEPDLKTYKNLSEFFYRKLKPGVRPICDSDLVSPSDGKILKFGVIENGEIEQVKGMTYSIDALLGLKNKSLAAPSQTLNFDHADDDEHIMKRDEEFARINGISYSVDDLLGGEDEATFHLNDLSYKDAGDGTAKGSKSSISKEISVAQDLAPAPKDIAKLSSNKQLYFAVIYLAPGDYHRFHSPTNWVTTLRRHFIGELFSVAPFFQKTLQGLFVLNERVALLGYWKHGFFSMIPVGATNVGSIIVNFDKDLKTNDVYENDVYSRSSDSIDEKTPLMSADESTSDLSTISGSTQTSPMKKKKLRKNTVYEATYTKASRLLSGYPLVKGQEVGGFKLGSTVVLVFEAPDNFKFNIDIGQKVEMGQSLGGFE